MIYKLRSMAGIALSLFITQASAAASTDGELSKVTEIVSTHADAANEGDLKLEYWTFLRGPEGLQVPILKGKISITDKKE